MMDIVNIASIVSSITFLIGTCYKVFSVLHKTLEKLDELDEAQKRSERHIMKIALFNEGLPLEDRIQCGKRYLELGGNGTGKIQYDILLERMETAIDHHFVYNTDKEVK